MIALVAVATAAEFPSSPPLSIDDAETVEALHAEINVTVGASGQPGAWEAETPLVDANLGLTSFLHVNAEIPYVVGDSGRRFGNAAVAVKVRVLNTDRVSIAVHPAVDLPPIPGVSFDNGGGVVVTVPVVVDVAVGEAGFGFQLSRSFSAVPSDDTWAAAVGVAEPVWASGVLMFDYTQEAGPQLQIGEGWLEVGYVQEGLFGSDHLTLLSSLGRSTLGNTSVLLGVQVGL